MIAKKITVEDVRRIGTNCSIIVELPSYAACISAKNTVYYTKKAYPRPDGLDYYCRINGKTITIGTAERGSFTRKTKF